MALDDWSTTAGSNTAVGGVSIAEGMTPGNVNNAIRGLMSEVAVYRDVIKGGVTSGGTADAQTITTGMSVAAYSSMPLIAFEAGAALTNTTTTTINVDAIGVKTVKRVNGSNLSAGDITAGGIYLLSYEAGADVLILLNPSPTGIGAGLVSDTAYAGSWDSVTTIAPSKNAVYDKIETLTTGAASSTDNAVARMDSTSGKLIQNSAFVVDDSGHVSSFGGNIAFPATQAASANANTLDDYEEGTWTPVLTFATLGNLSVVYTTQLGLYVKIGKKVVAWFNILTSTFTHTTASGNCEITGLPFTNGLGLSGRGALGWQGITKAGYTDVVPAAIDSATLIRLTASASASAVSNVTAADMPTGGTVSLQGHATYAI